MKKIFGIGASVVIIMFFAWAGVFYWQNLHGIRPAVNALSEDIVGADHGNSNVYRYKDLVEVTAPREGDILISPFIVQGRARGSWFFEASFPVRLSDANGKEIAVGIAQAQSNWMTEDFVPFEAKLAFQKPATETGTLILQKDNPSGLSEFEDAFQIPVRF